MEWFKPSLVQQKISTLEILSSQKKKSAPQTLCHIILSKDISFNGPQEGRTFTVMESREGSQLGGGMNLRGGFDN